MSEGYIEYDGQQYQEPPQQQQNDGPQSNADFAALRRATTDLKKAQAEADATKRELAFYRAGINPDTDPRIGDFVKAYDGEVTVDAIKAAAEARGYLAPPAPTQEQVQQQQIQDDALAAQYRIAGVAGPGAIGAPTTDQAAMATLQEAWEKGGMDGLSAAMRSLGIPEQTN